ncbi:hypothetical protein NP233_g3321 [Leucocoprinus birnbaumii]|uniref:Uncharacterized protein n=1 Tax=Leucocoprinus birnbaumii TaxID=56174 RepID=A0AAD5VWQ5_9AGAR|nr:hypothetical protein NP233_g3321 [Leucocoprinus birnbaumii]
MVEPTPTGKSDAGGAQLLDAATTLINELSCFSAQAKECALEMKTKKGPPESVAQNVPNIVKFWTEVQQAFQGFHDICVLSVRLFHSLLDRLEGGTTSSEGVENILVSLKSVCVSVGKLLEEIVKVKHGSILTESNMYKGGFTISLLYVLFMMMFEGRNQEFLGITSLEKAIDSFADTWKTVQIGRPESQKSAEEVIRELKQTIVHVCIMGDVLKPYDEASSIGRLESPYMRNVFRTDEMSTSAKEQLYCLRKYMSEGCWERDDLKRLFNKNVLEAIVSLKLNSNVGNPARKVADGYQEVYVALVMAFNRNRRMENCVWEWRFNKTLELIQGTDAEMRKFIEVRDDVRQVLQVAREGATRTKAVLEKLMRDPKLKCTGVSPADSPTCRRCTFKNLLNHITQAVLEDFLNPSRWTWTLSSPEPEAKPRAFIHILKLLLSNSEGGRGHYQHEILNAMFPEEQGRDLRDDKEAVWNQVLKIEVPVYSLGESPIVDPNPDTPYMDRPMRITWNSGDMTDEGEQKLKKWEWAADCTK